MGQQGLQKLDDVDTEGGGDETLLPEQFWAALADPRSEPEKRLMVAVLEEAISVVVNQSTGSDDSRSAVREAQRWFASDDRSAPFAFASVTRHGGWRSFSPSDRGGVEAIATRRTVKTLHDQGRRS